MYIKSLIKKKQLKLKFVNEKDNLIYNTSEGKKVFQEKIFTPFKTALIKAEHLQINK
jgi:hypothetical protein